MVVRRILPKPLPKRYVPPKAGLTTFGYRYDFTTLPNSITVSHNLDSTNVSITIIDSNNDGNYLTSYEILDSNRIRVYGIDKINTNIFTLNVYANTNVAILVEDQIG
jgi:hypothetical protein